MPNMSDDKKIILEAESVTHIYGEGTPFRHIALSDISLKIYENELIGVIGHTGSGKSTLMQHFNGLLKPTSGRILLHGHDINESKLSMRNSKFSVGLVMQYPEYQLFEETVYKDIAFGPINKGLSGAALEKAVTDAAKAVGLDESMLSKSPFELSGGQKRRTAIAGVLAMEPDVLILDEPTAGLDPAGSRDILDFISKYRRIKNRTIMLVSHNMDAIAAVSDRILVMNKSKIVMDGTPEEIFARYEELKAIGLSVPELTDIFIMMHDKGLPISKAVYTMDYAVRKLIELLPPRKGEEQ